MSIRRIILALVSGVLAVVLGFAWWRQHQATPGVGQSVETWSASTSSAATGASGVTPGSAASHPAATTGPSASSATGSATAPTAGSATSSSTSPRTGSPAPSTGSLPSGCAATLAPLTPARFAVPSLQVDSPVLSLGLAKDGAADTPPFDQPRSVGWFRGGPKPGSRQGKVVLTAHTFHAGGALGNQLFDASSGLRPGALVRISDAGGRTQCYTVTKVVKVMVKDYDPNSKVLYDSTGDPMLALVICWDWQPDTRFWASRVIFYATPLAQ